MSGIAHTNTRYPNIPLRNLLRNYSHSNTNQFKYSYLSIEIEYEKKLKNIFTSPPLIFSQ